MEEFIYICLWKDELLWEVLNIMFLTVFTTEFYFKTSRLFKKNKHTEKIFAYTSNFFGVIIFN